MIDPWTAFGIFYAFIAMDALQAAYTVYITRQKAAAAATSGSVIYLLSGLAVIEYTQEPWYLAFAVAGSWVGTFGSVTFDRYRQGPAQKHEKSD